MDQFGFKIVLFEVNGHESNILICLTGNCTEPLALRTLRSRVVHFETHDPGRFRKPVGATVKSSSKQDKLPRPASDRIADQIVDCTSPYHAGAKRIGPTEIDGLSDQGAGQRNASNPGDGPKRFCEQRERVWIGKETSSAWLCRFQCTEKSHVFGRSTRTVVLHARMIQTAPEVWVI